MLAQLKSWNQYLISILAVSLISGICLPFRDLLDYRVVGYLLLAAVSLLAIFLEIRPVLVAAVLCAAILDFLFIRPYYNFHIDSAQDALLLLLFFVIALVNAVLTNKIRKAEEIARIRETRWNTMRLYNSLLDSLSHELRTPISAIMGAVGTLQEPENQVSEENRAKLLSEMEKAALRLNHQVENLLNMSRLESGHIEPVPDWCDVNEIVYSVVQQLEDELSGHKIEIAQNDNLPLFKLDYGLTEQILFNLVSNAIQHTPQGVTISIAAAYEPKVGFDEDNKTQMTCIFAVSDDGNGFCEADIPKAFDKFYRSQAARTGGTGLGLSIVKGFAQAQGGTVSLRNKEQGGAEFMVAFPAEVLSLKDISDAS